MQGLGARPGGQVRWAHGWIETGSDGDFERHQSQHKSSSVLLGTFRLEIPRNRAGFGCDA